MSFDIFTNIRSKNADDNQDNKDIDLKKNFIKIEKIDDNTDLIENYIYAHKMNLDLDKLHSTCKIMYELIKKNFSENKQDYSGQSTLTTKLFGSYNLLLYPLPELHELYNGIKDFFHRVNTLENAKNEKYYIQCWLNFYQKGEFIDWHGHWEPEKRTWHGYFCVDVEPSHTTYIMPNTNGKKVDIHSKNNLLVMSRSDGDVHKSSEWPFEERPRITIAFDIVPRNVISHEKSLNHWLNHWIPI
jgi:hypothetical protein